MSIDPNGMIRDTAIEKMRVGDFEGALGFFEELLATTSPDWSLCYMAGQCCRFTNRMDEAVSYLSKSSELNPEEPSVMLALGIALQKQGNLPAAVQVLQRAVELDDQYSQAYNSLALTQRMMGDFERALENYDTAIETILNKFVCALTNRADNRIYKHVDTPGMKVWSEHCIKPFMYRCALDGVGSVAFPTGKDAIEEERTEKNGGLYWVDHHDYPSKGELTRHLLPNYFNTLREELFTDSLYFTILGNKGSVFDLLGQDAEAEEHFETASYFESRSRHL